MIKINATFSNITRCIPKEWDGRLQMHRLHGEFLVSNGFGGLGILDERTQCLLRLYLPISKAVVARLGERNGNGYNIEIKIFFP